MAHLMNHFSLLVSFGTGFVHVESANLQCKASSRSSTHGAGDMVHMHTYGGRISMFFSPLSNRSLAWSAGVIGVFRLATVHRLSLRCLAHVCEYKRYPRAKKQ